MPRKRWTLKTETTPALLKFREKRKWQIALRRYILEKTFAFFMLLILVWILRICVNGLKSNLRMELDGRIFGKKWQFDHIIPVTYFDFSSESELKMCWNFTNIRIEEFQKNKDRGNRLDSTCLQKDILKKLYKKTFYAPCLALA
ncbi:MAG: hypothetical protein WDO19_28180 [Bacteroidota bacterium]